MFGCRSGNRQERFQQRFADHFEERFAGGPSRGEGGNRGGWRGPRRGGPGGGDMFRIGRMLAHGDLKLLALALIAEQPRHGYEIIKVIEEKTGGWYSPSPGVVYPTLTFLEEAGYAAAEAEGARKRYAITEEGRAYLAENQELADTIIARLSQLGDKMSRARKWMGWSEGGPGQGAQLPRLVEAAIENLRDVAQQRLQTGREAETRIVEILARAANDIREA